MSRRIGTLHSSNRKSRSRSRSRDSNDETHQQEFYVGGGQHSGQQVLGPGSSRRNEDVAADFFNSALAHGAESIVLNENAKLGTQNVLKFALGSRGYRLGDTVKPSEEVETIESSGERQEVEILMWQNGFTVNGGSLRSYADASNTAFLRAVANGIPSELKRQYPGKIIEIRLERRSEPLTLKQEVFTGQGRRLGEILPKICEFQSDDTEVRSMPVQMESINVDPESVKKAQEAVMLVVGQPVTQIQIRLPHGERVIGRFNQNHTIQDVRNFLVNAVPSYAFQPFVLMTAFPSKIIEQENLTLKEAGLMNAVVLVKLV